MVPVGGEETTPVKETTAEAAHRVEQEKENLEYNARLEEKTKINEIFNVFSRRARISNKIDSMFLPTRLTPMVVLK